MAVDSGDAEVGRDGGEGIIGDFGAGVRDNGEKGGFAGVRQANQADVGQEFKL